MCKPSRRNFRDPVVHAAKPVRGAATGSTGAGGGGLAGQCTAELPQPGLRCGQVPRIVEEFAGRQHGQVLDADVDTSNAVQPCRCRSTRSISTVNTVVVLDPSAELREAGQGLERGSGVKVGEPDRLLDQRPGRR